MHSYVVEKYYQAKHLMHLCAATCCELRQLGSRKLTAAEDDDTAAADSAARQPPQLPGDLPPGSSSTPSGQQGISYHIRLLHCRCTCATLGLPQRSSAVWGSKD
jgi:hypothetical protein